MRIYLAGKVSKNDWRHDLVPELRGAIPMDDAEYVIDPPAEWPVIRILGKHDYVGPYFIACDHGCFHGRSQHGSISLLPTNSTEAEQSTALARRQAAIRRLCLDAVRRTDLLFAYVQSTDAFGSLFELGYAEALGKRIELGAPEGLDLSDWWLSVGPRRVRRGNANKILGEILDVR